MSETTPLQCDAVAERVAARGITRLRHFTTNAGLTGILATGEIRSRVLLAADNYLDRIYFPNCEIRHDPAWTGYVSISVTDINGAFFSICSGNSNWHRGMDGFWAIFEIDPVIASHADVYFATTNNRYSNVSRELGRDGLEAIFADFVYPFRPIDSHPALVRNNLADNQPTDAQAELLYPGAVPVEFVTAILVATENDAHSTRAQLGLFEMHHSALAAIEVRVDPDAFNVRTPGLSSLSSAADVGGAD